jgi:hypothetical protein
MKNPRPHALSYLAALGIGIILFATLWKSIFGSTSNMVVISGILGVVIAVILFLVWNAFKQH